MPSCRSSRLNGSLKYLLTFACVLKARRASLANSSVCFRLPSNRAHNWASPNEDAVPWMSSSRLLPPRGARPPETCRCEPAGAPAAPAPLEQGRRSSAGQRAPAARSPPHRHRAWPPMLPLTAASAIVPGGARSPSALAAKPIHDGATASSQRVTAVKRLAPNMNPARQVQRLRERERGVSAGLKELRDPLCVVKGSIKKPVAHPSRIRGVTTTTALPSSIRRA